VKDYEVEIAQGSQISHPVVEAAREGTVLELVARPTVSGSRLLVEATVQHGKFERPFRELDWGLDEEYFASPFRSEDMQPNGRLQLPTFRHTQAVTSRLVRAGGTFTIPVASNGRLLLFVVKTRLSGGKASPNIMDVGAISHRTQETYIGGVRDESEDYPTILAPRLRRYEALPSRLFSGSEELIDLITYSVAPWYWEEEGQIGIFENNNLYVTAGDDVLKAVRGFIEAREADLLKTIDLDLRIYSVPAGTASGPQDDFPAGQPQFAASLAALAGHPAALMSGSTTNYLATYEVEVAQESRISKPIVGQSFAGLLASLTPVLTPDGSEIHVTASILLSSEKLTGQFSPQARFLGPIDVIEGGKATLDATLTIPDGKVTVQDLGLDPKAPGRKLVLAIRGKSR
jgi:hypothetical protein